MKKKNLPYISMAAFLALGLSACSKEEAPKDEKTSEQVEETKPTEKEDKNTEEEKTSDDEKDSSKEAKDGTYEGAFKGMNDDIKVEVTLKDKSIESIEIVEHSETPGIGGELKDIDF